MAPLFVEASCLDCHARQGYRIGDVRGGISVGFNIDAVEAAQKRNLFLIAGLALASFLALAAIIYRLVHGLRERLIDAETKLRYLAITDELTGLKNRRYLMERLHAEIERMRRERKPLSCIMFDLDHFKRINDAFGHETGDRVLQSVAATTKNLCRESDVLCRFGGEEFLIILPVTPLREAKEVADRLRQAFMSHPLSLPDGRVVNVTASFGVAWAPEVERETDVEEKDLLKRADDALYEAKAGGRNRVISIP